MLNAYLLTCEHASKAVPKAFRSLFTKKILDSHVGYDIGAKDVAEAIAEATKWPLFCGRYSRLLVDLNRSAPSPAVRKYYDPFREKVAQWIRHQISLGKRVVHLSCHSFTPVLHGVVRSMDLGVLYDPGRSQEKAFAQEVMGALRAATSMRIRANAPYKGTSDGHTAALRKEFSADKYLGLEIEVNQSLFTPSREELWTFVWLPQLIEILMHGRGR